MQFEFGVPIYGFLSLIPTDPLIGRFRAFPELKTQLHALDTGTVECAGVSTPSSERGGRVVRTKQLVNSRSHITSPSAQATQSHDPQSCNRPSPKAGALYPKP